MIPSPLTSVYLMSPGPRSPPKVGCGISERSFISLQTVSVGAYGKVVFGIKSFCDVIEIIFITDTFARNSLVVILWRKFIIFQNFIAGECECTSCAKFYLAYILMSVHRHVNTSVANLTEVLPRIVSQTAKLGNSLTLQQNLASGRIEVIKDKLQDGCQNKPISKP